MPSKSRRSRRNISQNRPAVNNPETAKPVATQSQSYTEAPTPRSTGTGRSPAAAPIYPDVLNEIKWIGIVTAIVIAILIVLYYTVR